MISFNEDKKAEVRSPKSYEDTFTGALDVGVLACSDKKELACLGRVSIATHNSVRKHLTNALQKKDSRAIDMIDNSFYISEGEEKRYEREKNFEFRTKCWGGKLICIGASVSAVFFTLGGFGCASRGDESESNVMIGIGFGFGAIVLGMTGGIMYIFKKDLANIDFNFIRQYEETTNKILYKKFPHLGLFNPKPQSKPKSNKKLEIMVDKDEEKISNKTPLLRKHSSAS